jgi:hypothetical protein
VHPLLILLPSAALLGVAVCIASATFKKYCSKVPSASGDLLLPFPQ